MGGNSFSSHQKLTLLGAQLQGDVVEAGWDLWSHPLDEAQQIAPKTPREIRVCYLSPDESMLSHFGRAARRWLWVKVCDERTGELIEARNSGTAPSAHYLESETKMAKLYFRYGTVGSAKTLNMLAVAHNYRQQDKTVLVAKPRVDTRFGEAKVRSRAGLEQDADCLFDADSQLVEADFEGLHCVLVDEAQFLSAALVEQLRRISTRVDVPIICYGLRTNFRGELFEGSQRLMELADAIEEVKTTCAFCNRKAIFNLKFINGQATLAGPEVDLGAEEKYLPACSHHFYEKLGEWSQE